MARAGQGRAGQGKERKGIDKRVKATIVIDDTLYRPYTHCYKV